MEQNYKNHSRLVPIYHFVTPVIILFLIVASLIDLMEKISDNANVMQSLFYVAISVAILIIWWYVRAFPIKAQDRVILLEERLRHQQLTGKPLNSNLRPSQIIALRFASDAEFPALAEKAAADNMRSKDIKQSIKNWRADHHRV